MTIAEAISAADKLKPNQYGQELKIRWLSELDGQIFKEIFQSHENSPIESFTPYTEKDLNKELLIPFPYAGDVYNFFLQKNIDMENGEIAKYNQSATLFNNAMLGFVNWYNRTHMPIGNGAKFVF